ncbi:class III poly(R)-hydroxyalkanoic acid synthase subunit PhaE [Funiculus sociatus GB2-M2]
MPTSITNSSATMEKDATYWVEQTENLVKTWAETQKKIWESWIDFIRPVTTTETPATVNGIQNQVELWLLYAEGLQKLGQLSVEPLRQSLEMAIQAMGGDVASIELNNLYWDYQQTGNLLQSPSLGYTREFNNKLLKSFDAWTNFYKASFDYQLVLVDVWMKAFEQLMRLASSQEKGETLQNWRQFQQVWSRVFDQAFAQTFRSQNALEIQGKFLNAAMTYRLQQQQLMEVFLKMNNLPTRSEVDEIHRNVYELRKEIKSLKKALGESQRSES